MKISQCVKNVNLNSEDKTVSVFTSDVDIVSSSVGSEVNSTHTQGAIISDPDMNHYVELASAQSVSNQLGSSGLKFPVDDDMFAPDNRPFAQSSFPIFNIKEEQTVRLLATDGDYRNGLDNVQKDEVMRTLSTQLLEAKGLLTISRKLVKLKRVCECRGVDLNAFHDLWRSVDKRLTFLNVKSEESFSYGDEKTYFPAGGLSGNSLSKIVFELTLSDTGGGATLARTD